MNNAAMLAVEELLVVGSVCSGAFEALSVFIVFSASLHRALQLEEEHIYVSSFWVGGMLRDRLIPLEAKVDNLGTKLDSLTQQVDALVLSGERVEEGLGDVRDDLRSQQHLLFNAVARFRRQQTHRKVEIFMGFVIIILLFWIVSSV